MAWEQGSRAQLLQEAGAGVQLIAGVDGRYVEAKAELISSNVLKVWNDSVAEPVSARYAWSQRGICNLETESGLPVSPFRSDSEEIQLKNITN